MSHAEGVSSARLSRLTSFYAKQGICVEHTGVICILSCVILFRIAFKFQIIRNRRNIDDT